MRFLFLLLLNGLVGLILGDFLYWLVNGDSIGFGKLFGSRRKTKL